MDNGLDNFFEEYGITEDDLPVFGDEVLDSSLYLRQAAYLAMLLAHREGVYILDQKQFKRIVDIVKILLDHGVIFEGETSFERIDTFPNMLCMVLELTGLDIGVETLQVIREIAKDDLINCYSIYPCDKGVRIEVYFDNVYITVK